MSATTVRVPRGAAPTARPSPPVVRGVVARGDQRGRLLGFPTANLAVPGLDVPDSVWSGTVRVVREGVSGRYVAAVSIGRRPTYYGRHGVRLLEAHLLDFSGDLYGEVIEVRLLHLLRLQRRFPTSEALQEQLHLDVRGVRAQAADLARQAG
ncbi:riboflavin kinase [Cellulomonas dongxiuzhuiae]|uniref:riboflavin kinase n=1 Tax=Cellulomonas dongxiuzhuiae TaxID=2819979 RepID=A0ABX8GJY4_9CELL|nr:riboflavin kinase [Cellulomonas dongxiuzhuiae]MBO3089613.1 riboflavin kinase [Cellulomonas dongxiuzhuiae]MBO3095251.1 riboflavin kinase [Cellulomonas dongxiuzhuiae]QWC16248.1 riboflavin kinase [Cellulomonas dongxiuzhuiae]